MWDANDIRFENRDVMVVIMIFFSDFKPVITGVPQGSVVGPLFFLIIFTSDMSNGLENKIFSYADCMLLYVLKTEP